MLGNQTNNLESRKRCWSFFSFISNFLRLFASSKRQKQQLKEALRSFKAVLKIVQNYQDGPCYEVLPYLNALNLAAYMQEIFFAEDR